MAPQDELARVERSVIGRLAPSPTGALHLGNARSFLLAWLSARLQGGQVLLRIEDLDSPRVKPQSIPETVDDLRWLGLDWDADGVLESSDGKVPVLQSQRLERYRDILRQLIEADVVYPCTCTRADVQAAASAPHDLRPPAVDGLVYPGTCRNRTWGHTHPVGPFAWRWRFQPGLASWHDRLRGEQILDPLQELGDFVIARAEQAESYLDLQHTLPAYQLAVIVDDHDSRVTEVVRGDDLIYSTFRQQALLNHLGWPLPEYMHVPLIVGPDGRRLAKRHGDTRLSTLREAGISADAIVGYLAWTVHLIPQPQALSATELLDRLSSRRLDWIDKLPSSPTIFDLDQELSRLRSL